MSDYVAPVDDILDALRAVGFEGLLDLEPFADLDVDSVAEVIGGFGRFAAEVIAPTDRDGDIVGSTFDPASGKVTVPESVADAFAAWVEGGWSGMSADTEFGGGGLPCAVAVAAEEMFASANVSLSLNPMLTQGAIHLLSEWGSPRQQEVYLHGLVSGRWTGTMNLTEPDAGSDLSAVRTMATPVDDGGWRVTGVKTFITWGEHELADNIVHLVLARTPDAPAGSRGISLFLVPRRTVNGDGTLGERNRVWCRGVEHKLGIHASPTCVMEFDDATAELVGDLHGGLAAMFTMMNAARRSVGVEGLGISERAYQQAKAYATERCQGRGLDAASPDPAPIIGHPDVRRMLLSMATGIEAMRLLAYRAAVLADEASHAGDPDGRQRASVRADLLTPIVKAWSTDECVRITSLAIQVHGGVGYVEETGIAQRYRDARITPIYEGTNGIQAIDLVQRKVIRDGGAEMQAVIDDADAAHRRIADVVEPAVTNSARQASRALSHATEWLIGAAPAARLAAATPYLELASLVAAGGLYAGFVDAVADAKPEVSARARGRFSFFAHERLAGCPGLLSTITSGDEHLDLSFV